MAKFCIHCGNPLLEGQSCSCKQGGKSDNQEGTTFVKEEQKINSEQPVYQQQEIYQQQSDKNQQLYQEKFNQAKKRSTLFIGQVFETFKKVLKQPFTCLKEYTATGNHVIALGLIGLQSIMVALFTIVCFGKLNTYIKTLYMGLSSFFDGESIVIKFSLIKIFIITIVASFALSCALAGIFYLFVKLFKGNTTYKHMLCVVSTRSIAVSPIIVVAMLLFFIQPALGIGIFYLSNLLGLCFIMNGFTSAANINQNFVPYLTFAVMLVFLVVSYLVIKTVVPMFLPEELESYWNQFISVYKNPSYFFN